MRGGAVDGLEFNPSEPAFEDVVTKLGAKPGSGALPFLLKVFRIVFFIVLFHLHAPRVPPRYAATGPATASDIRPAPIYRGPAVPSDFSD